MEGGRGNLLKKCLEEWTDDPKLLLELKTWIELCDDHFQGFQIDFGPLDWTELATKMYRLFLQPNVIAQANAIFTFNGIDPIQISEFNRIVGEMRASEEEVDSEQIRSGILSSSSTESLLENDFLSTLDDENEEFDLSPPNKKSRTRYPLRRRAKDRSLEAKYQSLIPSGPDSAPKLTAKIVRLVNKWFDLANGYGTEAQAKKFEKLIHYQKKEWLDDFTVDAYMEMIQKRNNLPDSELPKVFIYGPGFHQLWKAHGYEEARFGCEKEQIFDFNLLMFPMCPKDHWTLVVVDLDRRQIGCYNSLISKSHTRVSRTLCMDVMNYLREERWARQLEYRSFFQGWSTFPNQHTSLPKQLNGDDCGVFAILFADYLARGYRPEAFDFAQQHIAYYRIRMAYETATETLMENPSD